KYLLLPATAAASPSAARTLRYSPAPTAMPPGGRSPNSTEPDELSTSTTMGSPPETVSKLTVPSNGTYQRSTSPTNSMAPLPSSVSDSAVSRESFAGSVVSSN